MRHNPNADIPALPVWTVLHFACLSASGTCPAAMSGPPRSHRIACVFLSGPYGPVPVRRRIGSSEEERLRPETNKQEASFSVLD